MKRYRRNPVVTIYNPPQERGALPVRRLGLSALKHVVGTIAANVHVIKYEHAHNGKAYAHEFEPGVVAVAMSDGTVLLYRPDRRPVWEDMD